MPEDRSQSQRTEILTSVLWHPISDLGAVAQLGERLLCKQEVDGSIPFSSTRKVRGQRTEILTSGLCPLTSETLFVIVEREWSDRLQAGWFRCCLK